MKDIEAHLQRLEAEAQEERSNTPEQQLNLKTAQNDLAEEFRTLSKERYELWTLICKIPNDVERTFLENRYYFGMSMKEVIESMRYSEARIYAIQRNAVKSFCQVFSKNK
jgi:DNA-directed RNA polymerase specialized sigma subunit